MRMINNASDGKDDDQKWQNDKKDWQLWIQEWSVVIKLQYQILYDWWEIDERKIKIVEKYEF